jgi:putative transposase
VVDIFTRLSPAIEVQQCWRAGDVVAVLDRAAAEVGYPKTIRLDNVLSGESRVGR